MYINAKWRGALMLLCCAVTRVEASTCVGIDPETNAIIATGEASPNCSQLLVLTSTEFDMVKNPFGTLDPDWSTVLWASGATLVLWGVGLGVGLVVSVLKKAR